MRKQSKSGGWRVVEEWLITRLVGKPGVWRVGKDSVNNFLENLFDERKVEIYKLERGRGWRKNTNSFPSTKLFSAYIAYSSHSFTSYIFSIFSHTILSRALNTVSDIFLPLCFLYSFGFTSGSCILKYSPTSQLPVLLQNSGLITHSPWMPPCDSNKQ